VLHDPRSMLHDPRSMLHDPRSMFNMIQGQCSMSSSHNFTEKMLFLKSITQLKTLQCYKIQQETIELLLIKANVSHNCLIRLSVLWLSKTSFKGHNSQVPGPIWLVIELAEDLLANTFCSSLVKIVWEMFDLRVRTSFVIHRQT